MRASSMRIGLVLLLASGGASSALAQHEHAGAEHPTGGLAWPALRETRDAIVALVEAGRLGDVHVKAERLAPLGQALIDGAKDLPEEKRRRVEATLRQLPQVAKALHENADAGKADATRRELKRLDGLLALVQAQYPADVLEKVPVPGNGAHSAEAVGHAHMGHAHGAHAHATRPLAAVDAAPQVSLRVRAAEYSFEPKSLAMKAGQPTRIELENAGAIDHSLIVEAPDGKGDWIHLHAMARSSDSGTFRIEQPGTYTVLCTVPGHTEAGMVGELVVR